MTKKEAQAIADALGLGKVRSAYHLEDLVRARGLEVVLDNWTGDWVVFAPDGKTELARVA